MNESTIETRFPLLVERLERVEVDINNEFNNEDIEELKSKRS